MSNHNYSQYSNTKKKKNYNKPKTEETIEQFVTVEDDMVPETVTTVTAPVEPVEVKMEYCKKEAETIVTGTIVGCSKLNVRAKPTTDADVLAVLDVNSEVKVDSARSTSEWVKVTTAAGIDGYCMRRFVSVKA